MDAHGDDLLDCYRCTGHEKIQYGVLDDSNHCIGMVFATPIGMPLMGTQQIKTSSVLNQMIEMNVPEDT